MDILGLKVLVEPEQTFHCRCPFHQHALRVRCSPDSETHGHIVAVYIDGDGNGRILCRIGDTCHGRRRAGAGHVGNQHCVESDCGAVGKSVDVGTIDAGLRSNLSPVWDG